MTLLAFLRQRGVNLIIIIYCCSYIQPTLANNIKYHDYNFYKFPRFIHNNDISNNRYQTIYIESDTLDIYYPEKIQLSGHVLIKHNDNTIISDKLMIYRHYNNNDHIETSAYAKGNVLYHNTKIKLTGHSAQLNLNNNNYNFYQSTYYISKPHIYGTASSIMQRKNNRYTIIKHGNCTSCISDNNSHWNIIGSKIVYDYFTHNIHIWNACLKIKNIPLFYSPYLSLSINNDNDILGSYIPYIKYSSKYGLILKTPFPLIFSKYYSGNISPYYIAKIGIGLRTKIIYNTIPSTGILMADIVKHHMQNNPYNCKNYKLHWKHQSSFNKRWYFEVNYTLKNNFHNYFENFNNNKNLKVIDDHINQQILCYYNNKHYKISIAYLGNCNKHTDNILQNNCFYSVAPQLETYTFFNFIQKKIFNLQIFNQFSQFIPSNPMYPQAIRIHTEPTINFTINKPWIRCNTETKLKITHYQQNNIDDYNIHQNDPLYFLQPQVNRIIPQFKINGKLFFQKKTNRIKKNKYFIEPTLQYLYIPYCFQNNIGIYDAKSIHTEHNNWFYGPKYSGLDRIAAANQITSDITIRCLNKQNDKFCISIGQILNFTQNNKCILNHRDKTYPFCMTKNSKIELYTSGIGRWKINDYWNLCSEIQYNTAMHSLSFGNTVLEYTDENNTILQTNYRYINSQYLQKQLIDRNSLTPCRTISQLGIITYYSLINTWIISCSCYYSIKSNALIDQTIGIRYLTPCWMFSIIFERSIIDQHNTSYTNLYDNKIKLRFNLFTTKSYLQSNIHRFIGSKLIPYQCTS